MVFGPSAGVTPANVQLSVEIIQRGHCGAEFFLPVFLDEFVKNPSALNILQKLDYVYYGGAPCSPSTIKKLQSYNIRVVSGLATTETAILPFMKERGDDDDTEFHKIRRSGAYSSIGMAMHISKREGRGGRREREVKAFPPRRVER